jgi:hypothetical protein
MQGKGTFKQADGSIYKGQFKNGVIEGKGTYTWADGDVYEGQWKDNQMHGKGTYTWQDGRTYKGDFHKGKYQHFILCREKARPWSLYLA